MLVQPAAHAERLPTINLTGFVEARTVSKLGFRFTGRISDRSVDVGDRVEKGQILANLDTEQQQADVRAAEAGVFAADATLKQAQAAFDREQALLSGGNTTRRRFDDADEQLQTAKAALDIAEATLGTARDDLANAALRADAAGVITARHAEAGQVVDAAQAVFTLAQDGGRDAIFDVYERLLTKPPVDGGVEVTLLSDRSVTARGTIREISPVIDPDSGTIRVKVGLDDMPPGMELGSAVDGVGQHRAEDVFVVPWTALSVEERVPVVWVVDPASRKVSTRAVTIDSYRTDEVLLRGGLAPGDLVVTRGMQLLRPGEVVNTRAAPANPKGSQP